MQRESVTVGDLPWRTQIMHLDCTKCGAQYSADRADYFQRDSREVLKCCDAPLQATIPIR